MATPDSDDNVSQVSIRYQEVREWPGKKNGYRSRAPFKAHATKLWDLLDRELAKINAKDVVLSGYFRAKDFKRDGTVYADARPTEPGVILEYTRVSGGYVDGKWRETKDRFRFACDKFPVWLDNVDAIARSLEALRMIDRYGVTSGQQYEGFKALPEKASETLTTARAIEVIAEAAGRPPGVLRDDPEQLRQAIRVARSRAHPDAGGSHERFVLVQAAEAALVQGGTRA